MLSNDTDLVKFAETVGSWSAANFGDQPPMCPVLGIVEELLYEYNSAVTEEEGIDCLADAFIFSCDAVYRSGALDIANEYLDNVAYCDGFVFCDDQNNTYPEYNYCLEEVIGHIAQAVLKNAQGIKAYRDPAYFKDIMARLFVVLYWHLDDWCLEDYKQNILAVGIDTFNKVVAKRDWKANPNTGAT